MNFDAKCISISVVSHGQLHLVSDLLGDLESLCVSHIAEVILTINTPEQETIDIKKYSFPIRVIINPIPQGFGSNHNQAFKTASAPFFAVLNPDIRLSTDPFQSLLAGVSNNTGLIAPRIVDGTGQPEDSARVFPTPFSILLKALKKNKKHDHLNCEQTFHPDWVAGMFMLFRRETFAAVGGFDERFFLYYEDVDLCARLRLAQYQIVLCPHASAIHLARRESHRNKKYMSWHLKSMSRFFLSWVFISVMWRKLVKVKQP